ncbi:MAG: hypothetical protein K8R60_03855 [Burkholderiales bacterium]|nr:hypothetical protein [Burkholderiales bacterium]
MNVVPIREDGQTSFAVRVSLRRAVTPAEEQAFERRVTDWLAPRGLCSEGGQLAFAVLSERELTATDQADMLIALIDDAAVRLARIGHLVTEGDQITEATSGMVWVEGDRQDHLVAAARTLYEARRLDGEGFLAAIGGFVYRANDSMRPAQ